MGRLPGSVFHHQITNFHHVSPGEGVMALLVPTDAFVASPFPESVAMEVWGQR
jgi:hypothetical protein